MRPAHVCVHERVRCVQRRECIPASVSWRMKCMYLHMQVEAEEVDDLAERFDVSAVPHLVILKVLSGTCAPLHHQLKHSCEHA